ncbi:putative reverse transcriptase domain-containing protein [Tanacetum coccineum]
MITAAHVCVNAAQLDLVMLMNFKENMLTEVNAASENMVEVTTASEYQVNAATVMSSSTVTYTSVYTDSEPWRFYEGSDEEPPDVAQYRRSTYEPTEDETPLEDQPLPDEASPTALSPGYVADSDLEEDPEEDPQEDHADYPAEGGDGDNETSNDEDDDDDADDEDEEASEKKDDDKEEEEHLALADSSKVPVVDHVPSAGDTEAFKTDESIPTQRSPQIIPSPPLHVSSPPLPLPSPTVDSPTYVEAPLGYRVVRIRMRATLPPLLLPSTSHSTDITEAEMSPWKRACFTTPAFGFEVGESSVAGAARLYGLDVAVMDATTRLPMSREECGYIAHVRILEARVTTLMAQTSSLQTQLTIALGHRSRNGNDSHDSGTGRRRQVSTIHECTYIDFLKFQPLDFKGTEGVVSLTQWTVRHDVEYAMPWKTLKKTMTDKYCPRGEIKKLDTKMWNLKVKGTDVLSYNQHFQELALMCDRMFPVESDEVKKYVGGLPDMIHGSVKASKPKTMHEAIEFATEMMDQKILTLVERQAEKKRKFDDTSRNSQNQQQPFKRNNVVWAYTARPRDKKPYGGSKPLYPKCNYHQDGQCAPKCTNCKRIGHSAQDYKSQLAAANNNQRAQGANKRVLTCFECSAQGHFRSNFLKLRNQNKGNQARNGNVVARAYVMGTARTNLDSNIVRKIL